MREISVKFIGKEHSIPQDVLTYIELLAFTDNVQKQLANAFVRKLKIEIQKSNGGLLGDEDLVEEIEQQVGKFIAKLCDHGIFTRTIGDYLNNNKGYQYVSDVNKAALEKFKSLLMQRLDSLQEGYSDAVQRAESHVTGMGFSIWSGSFVNHAIYAAMQASTINKQEKEASAAYQREINELCTKLESDYDRQTSQYINNEYIPNMEAAFTVLAYELLDRYVVDLIENGKFNKTALDFVNIGRSNDLLKNLTLSNNKQAILENAFAACPYNVAVYMQAMKYELLDYDSFQTAKFFKQDDAILSFLRSNWGEVAFPTKFNITYRCVELLALFTEKNSTDLLRSRTEQYATGVVKAYSRVADMLNDKELCLKIIREFDDNSILRSDAISKNKAHAYVDHIITTTIWNQLVDKCGQVDLLERIKAFVPEDIQIGTKQDVDAYFVDQLTLKFEEARQHIVVNINAKRAAEEKCRVEQERLKAERERIRQEKRAKRKVAFKKGIKISVIAAAIITALVIIVSLALLFINNVIVPANRYNDAIALMDSGDWLKARDILESLDDYKDSEDLLDQCNDKILDATYNHAIELMEEGKYSEAIDVFEELDGYKESERFIEQCEIALLDAAYDQALQLMNEGKYTDAIKGFEKLNGHKDSKEQISFCKNALLDIAYDYAIQLMAAGKFEMAISAFETIIDHKDSRVKIEECQGKIDEGQYDTAIQLASQGKYKDAVEVLEKLGDYEDSIELIDRYSFLGCEKGDTINFGAYEQDNNLSNGSETIEWVVLERNGNKALIVSKYCIEWLPFHNTFTEVSWKNSSIRKWLNNTFWNSAFTAQEKASIISTQNINPDFYDDSESERNFLGTTTDKVFLLSSSEADKYFSSDSARRTEGTKYACSKGKSASWYWWLRSANNIKYAGFVSEGELGYGEEVDRNMGIRPAMWIKIEQ